MKIMVRVELYTGSHREIEYIELGDEDLKTLAEQKAKEENDCDSAQARELVLQVSA